MVASVPRNLMDLLPRGVSIPFIAGQWSLLGDAPDTWGSLLQVSIPFIAGQWSLPLFGLRYWIYPTSFQSPSLRGSGRFISSLVPVIAVIILFQSPSLRGSGRFMEQGHGPLRSKLVSIPFIAGQWSLPAVARRKKNGIIRVSIPFIAGQWSLPGDALAPRVRLRLVSIPFIAGQWSLRHERLPPNQRRYRVSIPFIAGQWSLHDWFEARPAWTLVFQSPSLRGSGRFHAAALDYVQVLQFQSPSLRGSGRFKRKGGSCGTQCQVSIPFIAGQWSLLVWPICGHNWLLEFQSPSLRGSGRFAPPPPRNPRAGPGFNPLHCGAVVASARRAGRRRRRAAWVSIPFIAGQWSLHGSPVAQCACHPRVSIPFIAGQWSLQAWGLYALLASTTMFQSPSLRGSGRFVAVEQIEHISKGVSIPFIAGQWSLPSGTSLRRTRP